MREALKSLGNRVDQRLSQISAKRELKRQGIREQHAMQEREIISAMNKVLEQSDRNLLPGQRRNEVSVSELKAAIRRGDDDMPVVGPARQYVTLGNLTDSLQLERRLIIVEGKKTLMYKFGSRV
jgi:hypothetical protein